MPKPVSPSEFERLIETVTGVPEPDAQFMASLRERFILEGQLSAKHKQEKPMHRRVLSPRLTWSLITILIAALILLLTSPKVVQALKRLFGYVPGVGVVEQTLSLRILAEPVQITRDAATVIVEQAVLGSDKTVIVYSYRLPAYEVLPAVKMDDRKPALLLSNGARLIIKSGHQLNTLDCPECSMRYEMEFDPVPGEVDEITLELPSLVAVPIGFAPQDWMISLHFISATAEDVLPVVEYQPAVTPTIIPETAQPTQILNPSGVSISLDKSVSLPDGYIVYGSTRWTDPTIQTYRLSSNLAAVKDANGNEFPFDYAQSDSAPGQGELVQYWAYKINTTPLTGPVSLVFVLDAFIPANGSFTFEPEPNPHIGQTWDLNVDVPVNEHVVHVISAEYVGEGQFNFKMRADAGVVSVQVIDLQYPPMGGGGGGGGLPEDQVIFYSSLNYGSAIPSGPLTITINELDVLIPGDWQISWMPDK